MNKQVLDFNNIFFASINCEIAAFEKNIKLIIKNCKKAVELGKTLAIFPELAISGYIPEDLIFSKSFLKSEKIARNRLVNELKKPQYSNLTVIFGSIYSQKLETYNAAFLVKGGSNETKLETVKFKKDLPNYCVFDEERYFAKSGVSKIIDGISVSICEDIWNPPFTIPFDESVKLAVVINASPYRDKKNKKRIEAARRIALKYQIPVAYVNRSGAQDELVFGGECFFINELGEVVHKKQKVKTKEDAIIIGLKNYFKKNNFNSVVLGLSGGIDSALTAYLAVQAVGKENVVGVLMPSPYSSDSSITDSLETAKSLGIRTYKFQINQQLAEFSKNFESSFNEKVQDITEQNLQARIRGLTLMAFSNNQGSLGNNCLVLATGNKSELAVGYSTIYGDAVGGFAPLKDLYKTKVYEMAKAVNKRYLEKGLELPIPQNSINKEPSAELKPNQTDNQTLPDYNQLDSILYCLIEGKLNFKKALKLADKELVERVFRLVKNAEWKRKQYPIGPKLTSSAFGKDWRVPVTYSIFGV